MVIHYPLDSSFKLYTIYNSVLKILKTSFLDLIFFKYGTNYLFIYEMDRPLQS